MNIKPKNPTTPPVPTAGKAHPTIVNGEAALLGSVPVGGVARHDLLGQAIRLRHAHRVVGDVQLGGVQVLRGKVAGFRV